MVRGSRFLAYLAPATDLAAARVILDERTRTHPDATHHCWTYRLWKAGRITAVGFDAGEPSGTAGRPIAGALERADIVQAVCVVSRWFGGTRLGTGGLTRAYAEAASAAVRAAREAGRLPTVSVRSLFLIRFAYQETAAVRRITARFHALEEKADYGARIQLILSVPAGQADRFVATLAEAGSGAVEVERLADYVA